MNATRSRGTEPAPATYSLQCGVWNKPGFYNSERMRPPDGFDCIKLTRQVARCVVSRCVVSRCVPFVQFVQCEGSGRFGKHLPVELNHRGK